MFTNEQPISDDEILPTSSSRFRVVRVSDRPIPSFPKIRAESNEQPAIDTETEPSVDGNADVSTTPANFPFSFKIKQFFSTTDDSGFDSSNVDGEITIALDHAEISILLSDIVSMLQSDQSSNPHFRAIAPLSVPSIEGLAFVSLFPHHNIPPHIPKHWSANVLTNHRSGRLLMTSELFGQNGDLTHSGFSCPHSWNLSNISSLLAILQCDDEDIIVDTLRTLQKVASVDQMTVSMIGVDFCLHCVVSHTHLDLWSRFLFC
ncbi:hypothetical protein BLNAU_19233 [Blattamonas nauphoetae]|uniref:Uncharacterized protein n=1 Tax=Blattamonas nauphoetae TaxID=2049346 RepID=A0ABQ9X6B3_9EUKA|nr:hypothetical protein BLNAU_19233 [Blattamonas nauphoetae]